MNKNHREVHHPIIFSESLYALLALLALTVITVIVSWFDFGAFNGVIALFVATLKASIVLAIFMGLKKGPFFHILIVLSGVFFVLLLLVLNWIDFFTRVQEVSTL